MYTLKKGDVFSLESLKHDKSLHRRWETNEVLYIDEQVLIGTNHQTNVHEANKKEWRTDERSIFYLDKNYWFNIIILFNGSDHYYYCNLCSPFQYESGKVQYIDYDIDLIVQADGSYKVVDQDEFTQNSKEYHYPQAVIDQLRADQIILEDWIKERKGPFARDFIPTWLNQTK